MFIIKILENYLIIWGTAIGVVVFAYKKPLLTITLLIAFIMMLLSLAVLI